jgi:ABC-type glycerol-3-phosphate transport system substrate-binding protein
MEAVTIGPSTARRGQPIRSGAAGLLGALLLGCGAAEPCSGSASCGSSGPLQVATWWGTRGELYLSFDVLRQSYRRETRGQVNLAHLLENKGDHTTWVERELDEATRSKPLDVFSANNGDEVLHWTRCAASGLAPESPKLRGLTDPSLGWLSLDRDWIASTFEPKVMETVQCEGETYAIPVGIHRINTLFYNKELFGSAGYDVGKGGRPMPSTLPELHEAAAAVKEQLPPANANDTLWPSAFAVSGREAWTVSLFVIENLMLALAADEEEYQRYWRGEECNEALLARTLRELAALESERYFGNTDLTAAEARERVANGQAAMLVTGDWAMAEFDADEVGSIPFPGTGQYFVFSADVFALPAIDTANVQNGLAWLRSATLEQTQREFAFAKSARPARVDVAAELSPPGAVSPTWVRSLPALLPYQPGGPFQELQNELKYRLDNENDDGQRLLRYAREEYAKLSHGLVRCEGSTDPLVGGAPIE